ncbi:hypothetical protein C2G38_2175758 [Gigaspora rosea]|uniref:Uncharacterized protein n=1 Tax=Gigaspora rosea TaxID=44941 RepID=A0A397VIS6_9GLOM|nr:hypothetical protein C2G38_2175758 [Gigaspora rosea]
MANNFKKSKGTSCRQVIYEKSIRKSTEPFMIDEYEISRFVQELKDLGAT